SVFGAPVTVTATVTPSWTGAGAAKGSVTFTDGATSLGSVTVDSTGHAQLAATSLAVGAHNLAATFHGSAPFTNSTASSMQYTITQPDAIVTASVSTSNAVFGQPVTVQASVSNVNGVEPSGLVDFVDGTTTLDTTVL